MQTTGVGAPPKKTQLPIRRQTWGTTKPKHRLSPSVQNMADKYYISYNSQTVGTNDTYFAGPGRTITLGVASEF